jgi:mycofactocin system glycosyltransferase
MLSLVKVVKKNDLQLEKPAYRLRQTVSYAAKVPAPYLVLSYPLKSLKLHPSWSDIFKRLATGEFICLDEIISRAVHSVPDKVEFFLDELVRKGFLERRGVGHLSTYPFVSIIIPVRNRPQDLKACLKSLVEQDYPPDKLEIIVVDDASTDETPQIAANFPVRLLTLRQNKQAPYCRNLAARKARGDILAFIDSDCLATPLWLRELVPAFKEPVLGAVGGAVGSYYDTSGLDRYEKVQSSLNMGSWPRRSTKTNPFFYLPSCNLLVRRTLFLSLKGFNEKLVVGEDVDLCWRICDREFDIEYRPVGKVYHKHRNRLWSFCARRFDYGTSEPMLQQLHPEKRKQLVFAPVASVFWSIVIFALIVKAVPLLASGAIIWFAEALNKFAAIKSRGIPIKFVSLLISVIRSYLALFYHCCDFVSRYYLIGTIVVFPLLPLAAAIIAGMHLTAGLVQYFVKKPRLNPISFLFYFSMEQMSYQLGVWWGCFRKLAFNPVNPRVATKVPVEDS